MSSDFLWKIDKGETVKLSKYDPDFTHPHIHHKDADATLAALGQKLSDLQELLAAAQHHSLLIIVQGMDTSGKDGTISHVFSPINPQGCSVYSFKVPTAEEAAHDFLWRIHKAAPAKGMVNIFNRSQYEDVLVARVHNLVPEDVWSKRYKAINNFEKLLAQNSTIILKFFLYISQEEQTERLRARVQDKDKAWKISPSDMTERQYWDKYQQAYEEVLSKCSTEDAPWYIVPANHKWYRNIVIAQTLVDTLQHYQDEWKADLEARGRKALEEIQQLRDHKQLTDI
jgi:PPK2 family polyphosphate:nucleotide phosphotransferase